MLSVEILILYKYNFLTNRKNFMCVYSHTYTIRERDTTLSKSADYVYIHR